MWINKVIKNTTRGKKCKHKNPIYLSLGNWWCSVCGAYGQSHYEPEHRDTMIMPIEYIFWRSPKGRVGLKATVFAGGK